MPREWDRGRSSLVDSALVPAALPVAAAVTVMLRLRSFCRLGRLASFGLFGRLRLFGRLGLLRLFWTLLVLALVIVVLVLGVLVLRRLRGLGRLRSLRGLGRFRGLRRLGRLRGLGRLRRLGWFVDRQRSRGCSRVMSKEVRAHRGPSHEEDRDAGDRGAAGDSSRSIHASGPRCSVPIARPASVCLRQAAAERFQRCLSESGPVSRGGCSRSRRARSEEHTSELQSHSDLVCRLLLEKKKKTNKKQQI